MTTTLALPVTLQEAKEQLDILHNDLDERILLTLEAAIEYVEEVTARSLRIACEFTQSFASFPKCYRFSQQPVLDVPATYDVAVSYYSPDDATQTDVAPENYRLTKSSDGITILTFDNSFSFPSVDKRGDAVNIRYFSGYGADGIPSKAKHAILLRLQQTYGDLEPREVAANERAFCSLVQSLQWSQYR